MDVQAVIAQVSAALAEAPEKLQALLADPKGTIEEITGQQLADGDLPKIVDGVKAGIADGSLDLTKFDLSGLDLSSFAGGLGGLLGGGLGGLFGRR